MNYIGLKASCSTGYWISRNSSIGPQKRCDQLREPPHSGSPRVMASHKVFRSRYNLPIFCMVSQWSFLPCAFQAQLTFYLYHVFAGRKQKFNQESIWKGKGFLSFTLNRYHKKCCILHVCLLSEHSLIFQKHAHP